MLGILISLLIGAFSVSFVFIFIYNFCQKKIAIIQINVIDIKPINFYDEIILIVQKKKFYEKIKFEEKIENIDIFGFNNKGIIKCELILLSKAKQKKKNFKIKIYKNNTNIINIKANNNDNTYNNIEIIFYLESKKKKINLPMTFKSTNHNLKKRKRLLICNVNENDITKIIKDNINNKELQDKAIENIKKNFNRPLLLNIFINDIKSNILIFIEEDKNLIVPSKDEKKLFINFYHEIAKNIYNSNIYKICEKYKSTLVEKKKIFGMKITDLDDIKNLNIYFSFINQGINALFDNSIIKSNRNDYFFILGYILFYSYIFRKRLNNQFLVIFFGNMIYLYNIGYSYKDLIRIAVSYVVFFINDQEISEIKFTKALGVNDSYRKGFEFFKNIILDLNEDSDLIFIYLQTNSGCAFELMNNETCYKISMISIEDIKSNILSNIPQYFYTYDSDEEKYIGSDSRTQVMIFNEKKIFDCSDKNKENNNLMNITIGMFHESGHETFHMNIDIGANRSPILCVNKKFDLVKKYNWTDNKRVESGKFIDYFLYKSSSETGTTDIINSLRSNELMNKNYFIGDLTQLNGLANNIISKPKISHGKIENQKIINPNDLTNLSSTIKKANKVQDKNIKLREIVCDIDY